MNAGHGDLFILILVMLDKVIPWKALLLTQTFLERRTTSFDFQTNNRIIYDLYSEQLTKAVCVSVQGTFLSSNDSTVGGTATNFNKIGHVKTQWSNNQRYLSANFTICEGYSNIPKSGHVQ